MDRSRSWIHRRASRQLGWAVLFPLWTLIGTLHGQGEPRFYYPPAPYDDPSSLNSWEDVGVLDRFFEAEVYDQLDDHDTVDGALVGREGETLTRAAISVLATGLLERAATSVGVATSEISLAMLSGRFNPYFEDVLLAHEGLVPDGSLTERDLSPGRLQHLREIGLAPADGLPDILYLRGEYVGTRNERWNQRFGSMGFAGNVRMFIAGDQRDVTQMDLALRIRQRMQSSSFRMEYKLDLDADLTFAQAVARLDSDKATQLRSELDDILQRESVISYFRMGDLHGSEFNFTDDYEALRTSQYLPSLKQAHFDALERAGVLSASSHPRAVAEAVERMLQTIVKASVVSQGDQREEAKVLASFDASSCTASLRQSYARLIRDLETGEAQRNQGEALNVVLQEIYTVLGRDHALRIMKGSMNGPATADAPNEVRPARASTETTAPSKTPPVKPTTSVAAAVQENIRYLQELVLTEFDVEGLSVSGDWDYATHVGVTNYLQALQESTRLGPTPPDGLYTDEFRAELSSWLAGMDSNHESIQTIQKMQTSLDLLASKGIYDPHRRPVRATVSVSVTTEEESTSRPPENAKPTPVATPEPIELATDREDVVFNADKNEFIATLALVAANAFFWEWGDEWLGRAIDHSNGPDAARRYREQVPAYIDAFIERFPKLYWGATLFGMWISLGGVLAAAYARMKGGGFWFGFFCGCMAEMVETLVSYFGEVSTFGSADLSALIDIAKYMVPITGFTVGGLAMGSGIKKSLYGGEAIWLAVLLGLIYLTFFRSGALQ